MPPCQEPVRFDRSAIAAMRLAMVACLGLVDSSRTVRVGQVRACAAEKFFQLECRRGRFGLTCTLLRSLMRAQRGVRREGCMTVLILFFYKLLLTREEAAEMLDIGLRKLDRLVSRGDLKPRRIGDCVRFYIGELVRFASLNPAELEGDDDATEADNDHA